MKNYFDKDSISFFAAPFISLLRVAAPFIYGIFSFYIYSLNASINSHQVKVSNHESVISSHTARITEFDARLANFSKEFHKIQKGNDELLAYVEKYHGDDSSREDDFLRMQILLSEHNQKLIKLLEAIKGVKQ